MTDTSSSAETNFTGAIPGETPIGEELRQPTWDEYRRRDFRVGITGQGQEEDIDRIFRQQTGTLEETDEEDFATSIPAVVSLRSELSKQVISVSLPTAPPTPKVHPQANRIVRVYLTNQILTDIHQIQNYSGKPTAAVYANSLLLTMRTMDEISPFDPFVEVVMALHDALAYQNNWNKFSPKQYGGAYRVLKNLVQRQHISNDAVEKAIMELEKLGFDTTPFELDVKFGIKNSKD